MSLFRESPIAEPTVNSHDRLVGTPALYFTKVARLDGLVRLMVGPTVRALLRIVHAGQHALTIRPVDPLRHHFSFQSQITRFVCRREIILNAVQFFY